MSKERKRFYISYDNLALYRDKAPMLYSFSYADAIEWASKHKDLLLLGPYRSRAGAIYAMKYPGIGIMDAERAVSPSLSTNENE